MNPPYRMVYRATFLLLITLAILLLGSYIGSGLTSGMMIRDMVDDPTFTEATLDLAEQRITEEQYMTAMTDYMLAYEQTHAVSLTLASLFGTLGQILVLLLFVYCKEKASLASLGLADRRGALRYLTGCALGVAMFGAAVGLLTLTGAVKVQVSSEVNLLSTCLFFLAFLVQGAAEELVLRGFLMNRLRMGRPAWLAVLISSLVFAILHIPNEGAGVIPILNVCLFGVFVSLLYLVTGSLWMSMGVHSLWNFVQGNLFGCPVSGLSVGWSPLITTAEAGRELTHGGAFGPEGGLVVTLVLLLSLALLVLLGFRTPKTSKDPKEST